MDFILAPVNEFVICTNKTSVV